MKKSFAGLTDWFEVFRTGTHTDSSGETRNWSVDDLDQIVAGYDPRKHEAPAVVGHPKSDDPAFGWVAGLKRVGETLLAKLRDVVPEFAAAVEQGLYRKRSIALYPDMTLRHIGFLGGIPPAVKGLANIKFEEAARYIEFGEEPDSDLDDGGKNPPETPEGEKPAANGSEEPDKDKGGITNLNPDEKIKDLEARNAELQKQLGESQAQLTEAEKELAEKDRQIAGLTADARKKETAAFCDDLIREGKLTPAQKTQVVELMEAAHASGKFNFAAGEKPVAEVLKSFVSGLPKAVEMGETATAKKAAGQPDASSGAEFGGNVDPERLEQHNRIKRMAAEKGLSYGEAAQIVMKEVTPNG